MNFNKYGQVATCPYFLKFISRSYAKRPYGRFGVSKTQFCKTSLRSNEPLPFEPVSQLAGFPVSRFYGLTGKPRFFKLQDIPEEDEKTLKDLCKVISLF